MTSARDNLTRFRDLSADAQGMGLLKRSSDWEPLFRAVWPVLGRVVIVFDEFPRLSTSPPLCFLSLSASGTRS